MKKSVFVLALGTLCAATASANFYVQGDLGTSKIKWSFEDGKVNKSGFSPSLAVGYKFTDFRLALDYTRYSAIKYGYDNEEEFNNVFVSANGKVRTDAFGLSAIYDINLNSPLTPYVGARIAANRVSLKENGTERRVEGSNSTIIKTSEDTRKTKMGYGVLAGVSYKLTDSFVANAGVEYNYLGKFDEVKLRQYGAKLGLRYEF
ncbi:TPA: outer membrane beta-barrel protein [Pasteurella multocida]|uniref:opacity family porin n=1 Tax=Pasteurella multocida TaxID=747 RepID=UPI000E073A6E|nr:opacity family porin [Pasteurella multocida]MCL7786287.1 opacity family porin [Pasteurella multocida]MCL7795437.1 opacity family porin [Pasteurella multocida]MEB3467941.1 opacity family porin [Pasteurella multocida]MEB3498922.1 opacity family porin [Pasteurella multocida]URI02842.1 opacity family porin [Pasteurella multocida]